MPPTSELATVHLVKPAKRCFELFCEVGRLVAWVPGLRRAQTITTTVDGRARDVKFEFGESRTYSLVYSYDVRALRIEFVPGVGERDAVRGWAEFVENPAGGATMTYALDVGAARTLAERETTSAAAVAEAFARWVGSR